MKNHSPMTPPVLYKHENNADVAVQIKRIFYVQEKRLYKLTVIWWNIGDSHEPWCMNVEEKIEIPLDKWQREWALYKSKAGNS